MDGENNENLLSTNLKVVCYLCGKSGIKEEFYSKSKKYCSEACSKAVLTKKVAMPKKKKGSPVSPVQNASFDWAEFLRVNNCAGAPVSCFVHCPMSDMWDNIIMGIKIELPNYDCDTTEQVYWIATLMKVSGYYALMRYEGFSNDSSEDFWINLSHKNIHPIGWCATNKKALVPPKSIQYHHADWKDFLVKRLTGARTLPENFHQQIEDSIKIQPILVGMTVEVVDKSFVSAMRTAVVQQVLGGRLHLQYKDSKDEFWCHRESSLVHPVGWSLQTGHKLHCDSEYRGTALSKITENKYEKLDSSPDMFVKLPAVKGTARFQAGMKLEAIDPLNLSAICVATVGKVLKNDYLMIGIDGSLAEKGSDWFCYHSTSPCIFPVGFCAMNDVDLTPPRGYKGSFNWEDYLKETKSVPASTKLFEREPPKHRFKAGMKIEAVDLMEPRLICVATIARVLGRLLRIHFDGWESTYDQWVDCQTPDIYPIGWCELVDYHLEGPRIEDQENTPIQNTPVNVVKRKKVPTKGSKKFLPAAKPPLNKKRRKLNKSEDEDEEEGGEEAAAGDASMTKKLDQNPDKWSVEDVLEHLTEINCGAAGEGFQEQKIDGPALLKMTKDDIMSIKNMKVGHCVQIEQMIEQLRMQTQKNDDNDDDL